MNKSAWTYVGGAMYRGDYENGDLLFSFGDDSIARDVENGHITWDEFKPSEDVARILTAAPELLEAQTMGSEVNTPDFLDWVADRLVHVHGESPLMDYVQSLRRRAEAGRAAIAKATGAVS